MTNTTCSNDECRCKCHALFPTREEALRYKPGRRTTLAFRWLQDDFFIQAESKAHEKLDIFSKSEGRKYALRRLRQAHAVITDPSYEANPGQLPEFTKIVKYDELRSRQKLLVRRLVPQDARDTFAPMVPASHLHWTRGYKKTKKENNVSDTQSNT